MKSVGDKLKELRAASKMTQDDIAALLDMNRTSFSKYENDASLPPLNVLRKLSKIYAVPIEYLIHDDFSMLVVNQSDSDELLDLQMCISGFGDLTREEKMLVMKLRLNGKEKLKEISRILDEEDDD